jgi:hypothetical protein
MVGLGRLELPTSRLSSARSNQLSYKPKSRVVDTPNGTSTRIIRLGKRNEGGAVPHRGAMTGACIQSGAILFVCTKAAEAAVAEATNEAPSLERR